MAGGKLQVEMTLYAELTAKRRPKTAAEPLPHPLNLSLTPPERSEHNPSTQPVALAALLFLNLRRQPPPLPSGPKGPVPLWCLRHHLPPASGGTINIRAESHFLHRKPFTMLIDTLEYSPPPWYTMTTAHMQKKVTIEQYERLYFFSQLKETSR